MEIRLGVHCILEDVINAVNFLFIGLSFDSIFLALILSSRFIVPMLSIHV